MYVHVCMYVRMYVCMYVCMYLYMYYIIMHVYYIYTGSDRVKKIIDSYCASCRLEGRELTPQNIQVYMYVCVCV